MPLSAQLLLIGLAGAVAGSFVNLAIYSLAWTARSISPWSPAPQGLSRTWPDYLPIVGWLRLQRESKQWGRGFWVRPLLMELSLAIGIPWLYYAEIGGWLLPSNFEIQIPADVPYAQFTSHVLLILLMTVATFIDFDEQLIPDAITIPGTLLALILMTAWPGGHALPQIEFPRGELQPLWLSTFHLWWTSWLDGWPGLLLGMACFAAWCYAVTPRYTTFRRGWWKAWLYWHASMFRTPAWRQMGLLALFALIAIAAVWLASPSSPPAASTATAWRALLTSLVGMTVGGALVWGVRIVGYLGLRQEAMGFGDVTLMAMIGAFLGWQSTIMVFFLAPFAAVVIAVAQLIITRRNDIAFGPYLCGGALALILLFPYLWSNWGGNVFGLGWYVPGLLVCGLILMYPLLVFIRAIKEALLSWFERKV